MGRLKFINQGVAPTVVENVTILQQPISAEWVQQELNRLESSVLPDATTDNKPYVRRNKQWVSLDTLSVNYANGTTQTFDQAIFNGLVEFNEDATFLQDIEILGQIHVTGLATLPSIQSVNIVSTGLITGQTADLNMLRTGYVRVSENTDPAYTPVGGEIRYNDTQFEFYENGAWRTLVSGGYGYVADAPSDADNYVRRKGEWRRLGKDSVIFDNNTNLTTYDLDVLNDAEINNAEIANVVVNQLGSIARLRLLDFDPNISPVNGHVRYNFESGRFEFYEQDEWRTLTSSVPEVPDAPSDTNKYYRKDATWVRLGSESLTMDDGTTLSADVFNVDEATTLNGIVTVDGTIVIGDGNERNIAGEIRFNSVSEKLEYHNGTSWVETSEGGFADVIIDNNPYYRKNQIWVKLGSENLLFDAGRRLEVDSTYTSLIRNRNPVGNISVGATLSSSEIKLQYTNNDLISRNKTISLKDAGIYLEGLEGVISLVSGISSIVLNSAGGINISSLGGVTIGTNVTIPNLDVTTLDSLGSNLSGITNISGTDLNVSTTDMDVTSLNFSASGNVLTIDYGSITIGEGGDIEVISDSLLITTDSLDINASGFGISSDSIVISSVSVIFSNSIIIGDSSTTTAGNLRYNSNTFSFYNGSSWKTLSEVGHIHTISDVTDLQAELDDKSDVGHLHNNEYSTGKIVASQVLVANTWTNIDVTDTSIKENVYSVVAYELDGDGFWYPVVLDWRVSELPSNYVQIRSTVAGTFKVMIMFTTVS